MNIYDAVRDELVANAAVAAIVSTRIYANLLPQKPTLPAISYQQISQADASEGSAELFVARYQVNCYATKYMAAAALADAVVDALRDWGDLSVAPAVIQTRDVSRLDDYDEATETHRVILDFLFWICD